MVVKTRKAVNSFVRDSIVLGVGSSVVGGLGGNTSMFGVAAGMRGMVFTGQMAQKLTKK